jgi:FkbM family methyltransferase
MDYNDGDLCNYIVTSEIIASKNNPTCIDIGADKGEWGLHVLRQNPSAQILMFEPNPISFKQLQEIVKNTSVKCFNVAISNQVGTLQMNLEGPNSRVDGTSANTESVECRLLEPYVSNHIDIIKIDTEGHDMIILESLFPLIEKGLVGSIVTEFTAYWYGNSIFECFTKTFHILEKMLTHYKYCYCLSRRGEPGLVQIDTDSLEEFILSHYNSHLQTDLYFVNIPPSLPIFKFSSTV